MSGGAPLLPACLPACLHTLAAQSGKRCASPAGVTALRCCALLRSCSAPERHAVPAPAGMNQSTLLLYNNVLALPLMAAWLLLATGEVAQVASYPQVGAVGMHWCCCWTVRVG